MGCFSFLIMLLSYCHNFPVNIYLLAVTCFSPGAVKFIQRIHLHHFFFYQFFSSEFLVENLTYCLIFCGGEGGRYHSLSFIFIFLQQLNSFLRPIFWIWNTSELCQSWIVIPIFILPVVEVQWTENLLKSYYIPSFMLKSVEQKGPTVKLETGVPALPS